MRFPGRLTAPRRLAPITLFVAGVLVSLGIWIGASPALSGPLGPASVLAVSLLAAGLIFLLAAGALVALRVGALITEQASDAGARVHLRFVGVFSAAAVIPAVIVALFFGVLVNRGVEAWFSARVQTVVGSSASVAKSYLEEQKDFLSEHIGYLARSVNQAIGGLAQSPIVFSRYLSEQASDNGFSAAYILDREGRVLARAETGPATDLVVPPPASFDAADQGEVGAVAFEQDDLFRALYRLRAMPDAYLYVVRPVGKGLFRHLRETEASLAAYRVARASRARIQAAFGFAYLEAVLLVLVAAVWLGLGAARSIALPVARLVQAAGRVSAGDLTARVEPGGAPAEIAALARAFNRMTMDLREQQNALREASREAEARRQFTETVLLGVSAGVIGLDAEGRISTLNDQALTLLSLEGRDVENLPLVDVAPELTEIARNARIRKGEAEADVDILRNGETRRLRVRANLGGEGLVLTFDDITRLIAAQRSAAWRDVARRIAHEIKNPLTPIQLSAERLRRKFRGQIAADADTFDQCTDTIIRQVGDIGRMVDEFSAFARMPAPQMTAQDGVELLRRAAFSQRVADPSVEVEIVEAPETAPVQCDGAIVGQALTNVLKNAGEAISARRHLEPELKGRIEVRLRQENGQMIFEIEDNGVGLPDKDRDRLIEPYVTNREKGTGLGLAIVKRIIEDHGGELILADARTGRGARVCLSLPTESHVLEAS